MKEPHILLAPDSFKGSLSSTEAASCMEEGIRRVYPDAVIRSVPIADGGEGTVEALGVSLRDAAGHEIGFGGGALGELDSLDIRDLDPRLAETVIVAACDVRNPLTGPNGAAMIYGPQKGATPEEVRILDRNLRHYASVVARTLGTDASERPGAGAGGGIWFGLMAFCGVRMRPGIDLILDTAGFDRLLEQSDLVLTGEGRIDAQSAYGKAVSGIAARSKKRGVPVLAIAGGGVERIADPALRAWSPRRDGDNAPAHGAARCIGAGGDAARRRIGKSHAVAPIGDRNLFSRGGCRLTDGM